MDNQPVTQDTAPRMFINPDLGYTVRVVVMGDQLWFLAMDICFIQSSPKCGVKYLQTIYTGM
ncbi:MAG: hypothetical protein LUE17_12005, partial [Planctomycetaceae bacterium]|nr:hypothetical protein [Planctomycetaceae bacterium]